MSPKKNYSRVVYVVEMADEHFGWVICATKLSTRFSEACQSLADLRDGWPGRKFRINRYEPVRP